MRTVLAGIAAVASTALFAADPTTLVIPKITKPLVEAAENDPLQSDYGKMWTEYEEAVQKATGAIRAALDKQVAKATDSGELELVEMWEGKRKHFAEKGVLDWDTGSKASVEWKKTNPKVPYPREFNEAVRGAASSVASAKEKLEEGYADLVKAYTKAKNVLRAKELRDEGAAVLAGNLPPAESASVARGAAASGTSSDSDRQKESGPTQSLDAEPSLRIANELPGSFAAVTADGREAIYEAGDPLKGGEIWHASRQQGGGPFRGAKKLLEGRHPAISGDGLTLIYARKESADAPFVLWATTRIDRSTPFTAGRRIKELELFENAKSPFLSQDGLTLVFRRVNEQSGLVFSRRPSLSAPWTEPQHLLEQGIEQRLGGYFCWTWLSEDGMTLVSTLEGKNVPAGPSLYRFTRPSTDALFGEPKPLKLPQVARRVTCVRYVSATQEVFMTAYDEGPRIQVLTHCGLAGE